MARWWLGVVAVALCGCNDGYDLFDFVDDTNKAGAKIQAEQEAVVQCVSRDFELLRPLLVSAIDAALGDVPGPVAYSVPLAGGAVMDIEVAGMDGAGLVADVPMPVTFLWSLTTAGTPGPEHTGDVTITLESDGAILVTGSVGFGESCTVSVLRELVLRVDADAVSLFHPIGTGEVEAAAVNLLVVLTGTVAFDGAGRADVDGSTTHVFGPSAVDFSVSLD
jgi:hypothetical protein